MKKHLAFLLLFALILPTLALANAPSPFNQGHVAALEAAGLDAKAILATYGTPQLTPAPSDEAEAPVPFRMWTSLGKSPLLPEGISFSVHWAGINPAALGQTGFTVSGDYTWVTANGTFTNSYPQTTRPLSLYTAEELAQGHFPLVSLYNANISTISLEVNYTFSYTDANGVATPTQSGTYRYTAQ